MQENGNDLEKTIAGWDQVVAHAKDAAKGNPDEGGAQ
jgi:phospholipid transport system substrate-binding protein